MVESALNVAAEAIVEYGAGAPALGRRGNRGPDAAPQGVYPGSADDSWVALAVETDAQWDALVASPRLARRGRPTPRCASAEGRRARHDLLDKHLGAWTTRTHGRGCRCVTLGRRCARRGGHRSAGRAPQPPAARPRPLRDRGPPGHRAASGAHPAVPVRARARGGCAPRLPRSGSTTTRCSARSAWMPTSATRCGRRHVIGERLVGT